MSKGKIRKKAAALGYDARRDNAPRVLAKGSGEVASRIIKLAKEHDVPIKEDADLVALLSELELGEIPLGMYQAVAEVFAYIYKSAQDDR